MQPCQFLCTRKMLRMFSYVQKIFDRDKNGFYFITSGQIEFMVPNDTQWSEMLCRNNFSFNQVFISSFWDLRDLLTKKILYAPNLLTKIFMFQMIPNIYFRTNNSDKTGEMFCLDTFFLESSEANANFSLTFLNPLLFAED